MESAAELEESVGGRTQADPAERRPIRERSWNLNMVKGSFSVAKSKRLAVVSFDGGLAGIFISDKFSAFFSST